MTFYQSSVVISTVNIKQQHFKIDRHRSDLVFDCTYNASHVFDNVRSALTLTLVYKRSNASLTAITDGPFCCLYPYDMDKSLYTLTHVAKRMINACESLNLDTRRNDIEQDLRYYSPGFLQ